MAHILLAEDDESMRVFLAKALERAGHSVIAVGDGIDAMTELLSHKFDLLLADIVMPGLDGIELARRAGADDPELRIMLITGFAAVAVQARSESLDRTRVLSKPVHLRDLVAQVDDYLEPKKAS